MSAIRKFFMTDSSQRMGLVLGGNMIELTKLNGQKVLVNADLIELVEETPDTVVAFTTGRKIIVKEGRQEIRNLVKSYRKEICAP